MNLSRMLLLELINFKLQRNFSVKRWSVHLIKLAAKRIGDRRERFDKFMMFSVLNRLLFPSERKSSKINKAATWKQISMVSDQLCYK